MIDPIFATLHLLICYICKVCTFREYLPYISVDPFVRTAFARSISSYIEYLFEEDRPYSSEGLFIVEIFTFDGGIGGINRRF